MAKDPHAVLGVVRGATPEQIKKAYRRKAQQHHPDRNPDDAAAAGRFQEITAAYQALSGSGPHHASGGRRSGPDMDMSDFFDLFNQAFRQPQTPMVGIQLPLETIAQGGPHTFDVDTPEPCSCTPAKRAKCPICHGTGVLRHRRRSYEVDIPAGAVDGLRLLARLKGKTDAASEQVVVIQTLLHPVFQREGADLFRVVVLNYPTLVLGGTLETGDLSGPVSLKLPAGIRPGQNVRLAGRGLPRMEGGRGDLYLQVTLAMPEQLTPRQQKAMEELALAMAEK
jgi:DnaJ-class molecular chaperone